MSEEKLTIKDERNGSTYELPIEVGHVGVDEEFSAIRTADLRQIKHGTDEFGLLSYDPALMNTASTKSSITFIDGDKGILRHRGYPIEQLAKSCSFDEVSYLILNGELPNEKQLSEFKSSLVSHRPTNHSLAMILDTMPREAPPMGMLISQLAALGTYHPDAHKRIRDPRARRQDVYRLISQIGVIGADIIRHAFNASRTQYGYGASSGGQVDRLDYAAWFLSMMKIENETYRKAVDVLFTLHIDHEQNASANVMRAIGSTDVDPYSAAAGAAAALYGPLHGGANEAVLRMLQKIGSVDNVPRFIERVKAKEEKLMGFGHRVYKNYDPRALVIKGLVDEVLAEAGADPLLDIARALEETALTDDYFVSRKLFPNVDFYSGLVWKALHIPTSAFTILFAVPRMVGWLAQWEELLDDPEQKISRPRQLYVGHGVRDVIPISER
jgi:citrate synthase